MSIPLAVSGVSPRPTILAMPKSASLTWPASSSTLAGLRSRCTIPAACAVARASQIWAVSSQASPGASLPPRRCWYAARSPSAIRSMTSARHSPSTTMSYRVTTFGCLSLSKAVRSLTKRDTKAGSAAYSCCSTLIARSWPVTRSLAARRCQSCPCQSCRQADNGFPTTGESQSMSLGHQLRRKEGETYELPRIRTHPQRKGQGSIRRGFRLRSLFCVLRLATGCRSSGRRG
jgi:hypothetical protein